MTTESSSSDHFKGKSVIEHLRTARTRGAIASGEIHGRELPSYLATGLDAAKEITFLLSLFIGILLFFSLPALQILWFLAIFSSGWAIWRTGRAAYLDWAKLERLHRLMEQERWEIENNRSEEREELTALYQAKGFSGKLLEQVIDVLMADDNRLLHVMLEEEMGLTLESFEHPLKTCFGTLIAGLASSALVITSFWAAGINGAFLAAFVLYGTCALIQAKGEKNNPLKAVIWSLSIALFSLGAAFTLCRFWNA